MGIADDRSRRTARSVFLGSALAVLLAVTASSTASAAPAERTGGSVHSRTDVWIRDNTADNGDEPSTGIFYNSPDIKVCHTETECATSVNPIAGATNWVYVTLHRPGPMETSGGDAEGAVLLYYSTMDWLSWPGGWKYIGSSELTSVPLVGSKTVKIKWSNVPGPSHVCMLARWISSSDPMAVPEGVETVANTTNNNNIAWRNFNSVWLSSSGGPSSAKPSSADRRG